MQIVRKILRRLSERATPLIGVVLAIATGPAHAQFEPTAAKLNNVQAALIGVGVTIITCALVWIGYKMIFDHAKWADMTKVFWGGAIAGSAPLIAAWLFS